MDHELQSTHSWGHSLQPQTLSILSAHFKYYHQMSAQWRTNRGRNCSWRWLQASSKTGPFKNKWPSWSPTVSPTMNCLWRSLSHNSLLKQGELYWPPFSIYSPFRLFEKFLCITPLPLKIHLHISWTPLSGRHPHRAISGHLPPHI